MVATVLAVRDVLCVAVVVEVAALAEGGEVGWVVVGSVAVEVCYGKDDFHRAQTFVVFRGHILRENFIKIPEGLGYKLPIQANLDKFCRNGCANYPEAVSDSAPFAALFGAIADFEGDFLPIWRVVLFAHHGVVSFSGAGAGVCASLASSTVIPITI